MLKNIRSYFYKFKGLQAPLEKYVFSVILLLYPFIGINQGLDITDTTYSLGNYQYVGDMDPMWLFSTFLSNGLGALIMKLPFAGSMLGFSIYATFLICILALVPYFFLQSFMPGWMIFIGLFIAESLCWCPRVILYNYLTYLLFTLGILFLIKGIFAWKHQNVWLYLAGVMLGLNVMARFPNLLEAAMILVLWFYSAITHDKFQEAFKKTFICILGYLTGFGIPFIESVAVFGPGAYVSGIMSLFGMTNGASDYTSGGMLSLIMDSYLTTLSSMIILIPCMMAGFIMFLIREDELVWLKKLLYILGMLVIIRFYFSRGVITRNYGYYDSIFRLAMMFVIFMVILCIIGSMGILNGSKEEQTLAFAALLTILITPLGSNNYTYPVLNNLFFAAPVSLWLLRRLIQRLGEKHCNFAWQSTITVVIIALLVQGFLFHLNFSFLDGTDGTVRDSRVDNIQKVCDMWTSKDNAGSLMELKDILYEENLLGKDVLLFGSVPGLSYIFDMKPAISTTWPDLDSFSVEHFLEDLSNIPADENSRPVIITGSDIPEYANASGKYDILLDYISNHGYNKVFESNRFVVYY